MSELSNQIVNAISLWEEFQDIEPSITQIRRSIFSPLAQELGWETKKGEPEMDKLLRVLVLSEAGLAGDDNVISEAKRRYRRFIDGEHDMVSPDLRGVVYRTMLKQARDEKEEDQAWNEIFNIYSDESFPMDQRVIALTSLGNGIQSEAVIAKTLVLITDEEQVRTQDAWMFFRS